MQFTETHSGRKEWLDDWHVNPSVNRDYDFIDGLRGIAILMVILCHMVYYNPLSGLAVRFIGACFGSLAHGVTLFFALSGFLISWPFWKLKVAGAQKIAPSGYAWRRFWKIYPPLALSILLLTPIYIFRDANPSLLTVAAKWLVGLPFLLPVSGRLNPVMWSLVVEAQFYVVLPLCFLALRRVSPGMSLWIITLVFLLAPFSVRLATRQSPGFFPEINAHFPSGLDYFCLGIFVAGLDNLKLLKPAYARIGSVGFVLLAFSIFASAWETVHPASNGWTTDEVIRDAVKLSVGCLLFLVAAPQQPFPRVLCAPWLRWCGIISYEWYLIHQPIYFWTRESMGSAHGNIFKYAAVVAGPFVVSLFVAATIYRFFSLPILKGAREKRPGRT